MEMYHRAISTRNASSVENGHDLRLPEGREEDSSSIASSTDQRSRAQWDRPIEFFLSLVGYAVGLGNIWRFPYVVMENGGGAFLIPYLLFLFICGIPLGYMEMTLGQFTGLSPVRAFNFAPLFKGVGWAMIMVSGILCIYYNILMAYVIYYFGMSFHWDLPWKHCNNTWNTANCFSIFDDSINSSILIKNITTSADEFWEHNVLEISADITVLGGINWKLLVCMIVAWLLTFLCLMKGIRSSGKVVYVTALLPYVLLTIILIRGVTLPGAWIGLEFYLKPEWTRLLDSKLWSTAAVQIFYSIGPAWGGLITMSSYNKVNRRYNIEAILMPIICCATSIYGGFAIFSVIGNMAHSIGSTDVKSVMKVGPGLVFNAYPQALAMLPGAPIWTVLFFGMLITLGLDSQFATLETMTSGFIDQFPQLLGNRKISFTFVVCFIEFLLGLILVTRAGSYYFQVFDWYATPVSVLVIAFVEVIALSYVYGAKSLLINAQSMLGNMNIIRRSWWLTCWYVLDPIFAFSILAFLAVNYSPPCFANKKPFPEWTKAFGWTIAAVSMIPIPAIAIVELVRNRHKPSNTLKPNKYWVDSVKKRHAVQIDTANRAASISISSFASRSTPNMDSPTSILKLP